MKTIHLSPAKKLIIASCISAAVIGALGVGYGIISADVQNYRSALEQTAAKISSGEKDFSRVSKIADLLKRRDQDLKRLQRLSVDRNRPLQFIETMEKIGHLTNTDVRLSVSETNAASDSLVFGATIDGERSNVRAMLALIQSLPYQITIDTMSFQRQAAPTSNTGRPGAGSSASRLVLTMRVKTQ